ncbi:hypothetical protein BIU98_04455 [Curtobacterium sp. MMLR14_010]|uniref:putative Ig domain-containing protein n=1 Tax=Curtobacterium sp. MMLR14_010 TaxID=1898743 RepID=UPI0008DDDA2A|nr:putative Ig domain-containing protein [Curtobacterium sp. MMLR14_010]OII35179.1 hypothetical protein BIU98_04455 [Curtobacterium sp. MMLR14_010]
MHRSTSGARRACAVGTTIALIGLTTGLGLVTATAASADEISDPTTSVSAPVDSTGPTAPADGTPAPDDAQPTAPASTEPAAPASTEPAAPASTEPAAPAPTAPATPRPTKPTAPSSSAPTADASAPATARIAAEIVGDAKVGSVLRVDTADITGPYAYAWSVGDGPTVSTKPSFPVTGAEIGSTITVVVTGADDVTAEATTAAVTEDVTFGGDATSYDEPLVIDTTAGTTFAQSFAVTAGSGDVTYSVGYAEPEWADPTDPDDQPASYLPDGVKLDPATGLLSGMSTNASYYDFTVVASNGTSTATQYVEVVVAPDAAIGVFASAIDTSPEDLFLGEDGRTTDATGWIITPDGEIETIHFSSSSDDEINYGLADGGQPTVKQGQSLWISGSSVDQYGNPTDEWEDDEDYPLPTVTSDHATDVIAFDEDSFSTKVTFPHASEHRLTVAQDDVSVSFPVTVVPTPAVVPAAAAPVFPVGAAPIASAPTAGRQLAYTGSDTTDALPWALAMLLAGAGLVGFRVLRRRTQR